MAWKRSRNHVEPELRYFLYVSDAKLEMLFDQIPQKLRQRLSGEAKIDLKLASLTIKDAGQPMATRMSKLKVVESYIDCHHQVGTIAHPGNQYFRGTMPMRWGCLEDFRAESVERPPLVAMFCGESEGQTVALVGSRRHVLSEQPLPENAGVGRSGSSTSYLVAAIAKHVSDLSGTEYDTLGSTERALNTVFWVAGQISGPHRMMEFIAVPLLEERDGDGRRHRVLATPLHIAHAD